jgi:hypothetical protein
VKASVIVATRRASGCGSRGSYKRHRLFGDYFFCFHQAVIDIDSVVCGLWFVDATSLLIDDDCSIKMDLLFLK